MSGSNVSAVSPLSGVRGLRLYYPSRKQSNSKLACHIQCPSDCSECFLMRERSCNVESQRSKCGSMDRMVLPADLDHHCRTHLQSYNAPSSCQPPSIYTRIE